MRVDIVAGLIANSSIVKGVFDKKTEKAEIVMKSSSGEYEESICDILDIADEIVDAILERSTEYK